MQTPVSWCENEHREPDADYGGSFPHLFTLNDDEIEEE